VTARQGRRREQLLYYLKKEGILEIEKKKKKKKKDALDRTLWRTRFGRGYVPVVRRIME